MDPHVPPSPAARRALLVDDEPVIRLALRRFFTRQGWAVDDVGDGERALALLIGPDAATYDVILSDLRMPGMSGEELYDRVAAAHPALVRRMIVSTGDSVSPGAAHFLARTGCAVLNKPFELAELRALVERVTAA
jgi:DNA-binding NtrC family response regulator